MEEIGVRGDCRSVSSSERMSSIRIVAIEDPSMSIVLVDLDIVNDSLGSIQVNS